MIHRRSVSLAVALGFAASLTCAAAYASQHQGGYEGQEQQEQEQQEQEQQRMEEQQPAREERGAGLDVGKIDKNQDQLVSAEEYKEWQESVFGQMDADRNNELNVLEFIVLHPTKMEPEQLQARFQELDKEDQGKLSREEYINRTTEQFQEAAGEEETLPVEEVEKLIQERG